MTRTKDIAWGNYTVYDDGRVFSNLSERFLKPYVLNTGYIQYALYGRGGYLKKEGGHRLVAKAFVPRPRGCNVVNHIDHNPKNNHFSNLEWTTHKGNLQHAAASGRMRHGSGVPWSKLREEDVRKIMKMEGKASLTEIAERFGTTNTAIRWIFSGRNWRRVTGRYSPRPT